VRNHQARDFLRDGMRNGDGLLCCHSSAAPTAVVGSAEVVREACPDPPRLEAGHARQDA
jgi:predicted RNA-binding protein with PUA-like domain